MIKVPTNFFYPIFFSRQLQNVTAYFVKNIMWEVEGLQVKWMNQVMNAAKKIKENTDVYSGMIKLVLFITVAIFIWIAVTSSTQQVGFNNEEVCVMEGTWEVTCGKEKKAIELPSNVDAKAGDVITLERRLDKECCKGNSIMFYVRQTWVQISIDGEVIEASDEGRVVPFKMTPGSYWHYIRLPENYAGKMLTIEYKPALDRYAGELPVIYTGNKAAFIYMVVENAKTSIALMGIVLVLGVVMSLFGLFSMRTFMGKRLVRMGLFAIASSAWLLLESRITQLVMGDMVVASYLLFACYYLLPLLACSFLLTYESMAKRRSMRLLFWCSAVLTVSVHVLQITGIAYYIDIVPVMHVMLVLIIMDALLSYIGLKRKHTEIYDQSIYWAMILLGICCLLDVLQYYIFPETIIGNFSKVGILLFFGYLAYVAVTLFGKIEIREAENRVYKKLAYTDMMTGLVNRTAFEMAMTEYRISQWKEEMILLVIDMIRLKFINDTYGHAKGDFALIQIAETIKKQFKDKCQCFRTGGDEFCVISRGITENRFAKMCEEFSEKIAEIHLVEDTYLSVSCGYSVVDETGIDACYKRADSIMYEAKVASRQQRI